MKKILFFCFITLIMLTACTGKSTNSTKETDNNPVDTTENLVEVEETDDAEPTEENQEEPPSALSWEEIRSVPPFPQTVEQIVNYPVGMFAADSEDYKLDDAHEYVLQLPRLNEDASEEELIAITNYLYSLFHVGYQDPQSVIKSLAISSSDNPGEIAAPEIQKEQYNVLIALDASGSMGAYLGSRTRMEVAKAAIKEFTESLPEDANVALRVYGHKGSGSSADKPISCEANEVVYGFTPYDKQELEKALNPIQPAGWTPLAAALEQAGKDLEKFSTENSRNIIYFVSDGVETCGGNPIEAAKSIQSLGIDTVVNIIGFAVENHEKDDFRAVAKAAGGVYADAYNQQQLKEQFDKAVDEAREWTSWFRSTRGELFDTRIQNRLDISDWSHNHLNRAILVTSAIHQASAHLRVHEYVTTEQRRFIDNHARDIRHIEEEKVREYREMLRQINEDDYTKQLEEIEKLYRKSQGE